MYNNYELWWVTGAQLLYGGETVKIVDGHSQEMVAGLNDSGNIPVKIVYKGTANSRVCRLFRSLSSTSILNTTNKFLGIRWTWTS